MAGGGNAALTLPVARAWDVKREAMKTQWIRRRWLVAGTSSLAGLVLLATVVLYTNIGAPGDEYASMPHPCYLVEGSIQEQLAGEVRLSQILNTGPGSTRLGLDRDTAERTCHGGPVGAYDGSVLVSVLLFYSAQFGLGRTGEEKAVDQLAIHNRLFSDRFPDGCVYEWSDERGDACGMFSERDLRLHIQWGNLYASVSIGFQRPYQETLSPPPERLLAELTEQIVSRLADEDLRLPTRSTPQPG